MAEKKRPPYTGAADIDALFERIRTMQAPKKIDTEWAENYHLAAKQPEAIPALLRWLGIIDKEGGVAAETWDSVRVEQSRPAALEPLVRTAYSDVFDRIDVEHATQEDLSGTFITAYGMGDPRRQVRCFLILCQMAGIPTAVAAKARPGPAPRTEAAGGDKGHGRTRGQPVRRTTSRTERERQQQNNGRLKLPLGGGVIVTLAVEIPAEWDEDQIRDRLATVSRLVGEAGLGAT